MVNGKLARFVLLVWRIIVMYWNLCYYSYLELPSDFNALQEEIERQKTALLEKGKRKETVEASGNDFKIK